ncbi:parB-like partition protein [Gemmatirosa kalamazoonensis]|uniref:ParB-like partition protein n=1 Tax=Gemmatirosa kalamazoonensis TaxID=861299 RepID=W0RCA5_9BACT|nr:ParB/RepB/Spo0J family partition protein [Gemmatirosa kalamazoonensis]AHG88704.1 parB-like partition protein [Gemmatirosa kalamazoonensis]
MSTDKPRRLGRGLEALLATKRGGEEPKAVEAPSALRTVPIGQIRPNPYQPRQEFRPEELADLESSLRANGLLQPITVRPTGGGGYELIAGERRYRAATRLGWTEIPAIVKEIDDQTLLTLALVENLQRADLNPIEEAEGYQRLIAEFGLTQQQVAEVVGKDRTTITNMLRLLGLPASVRRMVQEGKLTHGHARALLGLSNERAMTDLARDAATNGLSVRDVERRVRESSERSVRPERARRADGGGEPAESPFRTAEVRRIEDHLRRQLQTDVKVELSDRDRGEIRLAFYNADDFDRLLDTLGIRLD